MQSHPDCPTLTGNVHGKSVTADTDKVEGHTLNRHPPVGQPHSKDALHLHGPVLLSLDLHCGSLERDCHLQPCTVSIAPASLQHGCNQTNVLIQLLGVRVSPITVSRITFFQLTVPVHCYLRGPYPKTLVPDDSGSRISKWGASECGYIFPSNHSNRSLCQWQEIEGKEKNMNFPFTSDTDCWLIWLV